MASMQRAHKNCTMTFSGFTACVVILVAFCAVSQIRKEKKRPFTLKDAVAILSKMDDGDISKLSSLSESEVDELVAVGDDATDFCGKKKTPPARKKKAPSVQPVDVEPASEVDESVAVGDDATTFCSKKKPAPSHKKKPPAVQPVDVEPDFRTPDAAEKLLSGASASVKTGTRKKPAQRWSHEQFLKNSGHVVWKGHVDATIEDELPSPFQYFQRYIDSTIFDLAAEQTNRYSVQQSGHSVKTDSSEIRQLFALHLLIGILKFPRLRMYWSDATRIAIIADTMSVNRFMKLRNNLHLATENLQMITNSGKLGPSLIRY